MADRFAVRCMKPFEGVPVPEGSLKKRERDAKLLARLHKVQAAKKVKVAEARHALKLRTYKYMSEYKKEAKEAVALKREARAKGGFYKEPESKVIFAIRIKGINKLAPKPKMIFRLFRLLQLHNGVFIKVNKATTEMLKSIQPFIAMGYPSLHTIRKLVYKRGYAKVCVNGSRQRVKLQENEIIHKHLGKYGIHGIEDIVHEIHTCGPAFKYVNNFLWPFKLNSPRKGFVCKRHGFQEPRGGDWGNRGPFINKLVERMN